MSTVPSPILTCLCVLCVGCASFLHLSSQFYTATGDTSVFTTDTWIDAVELVLDTLTYVPPPPPLAHNTTLTIAKTVRAENAADTTRLGFLLPHAPLCTHTHTCSHSHLHPLTHPSVCPR